MLILLTFKTLTSEKFERVKFLKMNVFFKIFKALPLKALSNSQKKAIGHELEQEQRHGYDHKRKHEDGHGHRHGCNNNSIKIILLIADMTSHHMRRCTHRCDNEAERIFLDYKSDLHLQTLTRNVSFIGSRLVTPHSRKQNNLNTGFMLLVVNKN